MRRRDDCLSLDSGSDLMTALATERCQRCAMPAIGCLE